MSHQIDITKFLNPEERVQLEAKLDATTGRDSLMIRIMLEAGPRAQELLNLEARDIDHHYKTITIRGLKGSLTRAIPLYDKTFALLIEYLKTVPGPKIFTIKLRQLQNVWYDFRLCNKKIHCLRHSFAMELFERTENLRLVQTSLGHTNIQSTMVYAQYFYSTTQLRTKVLNHAKQTAS
jgi:integrase